MDIIDDPLVYMIDKMLEEEPQENRDYLGASQIGHDCSRYLWYKLNGHKEKFNAETIKRFSDGHRTEAVILEWLQRIGIELHTRDADNSQIGFSEYGGKFGGHYDGIGKGFPQAPKTYHIIEIKCVGEKGFNQLQKLKDFDEKTAILRWNQTYYSQIQVYMHAEKLTRAIHIVSTPGARNLISVRTDYDKEHAIVMYDKAKRIIDATTPPERIGGADFYKCKMCGLREVCHATKAIST